MYAAATRYTHRGWLASLQAKHPSKQRGNLEIMNRILEFESTIKQPFYYPDTKKLKLRMLYTYGKMNQSTEFCFPLLN
nr:hypothetical transcript [Hymenolepis microstoma]